MRFAHPTHLYYKIDLSASRFHGSRQTGKTIVIHPAGMPPTATMEQDLTDTSAQLDPLANPHVSLDSLSPELSSLNDLAARGAWRSILDKVSRSRSPDVLHHPHHYLTYLSFNVLALTKLRRFSDANAELESVEDFDRTDYRYESYPKIYPGRSGSMVPFSLRRLFCIVPLKLGQREEGLDRLYRLLDLVREKLKKGILTPLKNR